MQLCVLIVFVRDPTHRLGVQTYFHGIIDAADTALHQKARYDIAIKYQGQCYTVFEQFSDLNSLVMEKWML